MWRLFLGRGVAVCRLSLSGQSPHAPAQAQSMCSSLRVPFDLPHSSRIVQVGLVWGLVWYDIVSPVHAKLTTDGGDTACAGVRAQHAVRVWWASPITRSAPVCALSPHVLCERKACHGRWAHSVRWSAHTACRPRMVGFTQFTRAAPVSALPPCVRGAALLSALPCSLLVCA
jgi:hypothetical protein